MKISLLLIVIAKLSIKINYFLIKIRKKSVNWRSGSCNSFNRLKSMLMS